MKYTLLKEHMAKSIKTTIYFFLTIIFKTYFNLTNNKKLTIFQSFHYQLQMMAQQMEQEQNCLKFLQKIILFNVL